MAIAQQIWFNNAFTQPYKPQTNWAAMQIYCELLRNNGLGLGQEWFDLTVDARRDFLNLNDIFTTGGAVAITGGDYAAQIINGANITINHTTNRSEYTTAESVITFGLAIPAGQNFEGVLLAVEPPGATPSTRIPLFMDELATPGLPTAGSLVRVTIPSSLVWTERQA